MPEITATVVAKSASGVMLEENGPWYNWSKPEFRGEPFNTEVQKGDRVQITYATKDYDDPSGTVTKYFITTIDKVVTTPHDPGPGYGTTTGEPFPPDEDFPPGELQEAAEPVLDKDHSIVRQTCIKAAAMVLQHNMGNAEEKAGQMTYLAGVLEDWCWR